MERLTSGSAYGPSIAVDDDDDVCGVSRIFSGRVEGGKH